MNTLPSVRVSDFLNNEYYYNCLLEQETQYFQVDSFYILLLPSKDKTLAVIAQYYEMEWNLIVAPKTLDDVDKSDTDGRSRVFFFKHLISGDTFQPVKKIAEICRSKGIISILDVTESIRKLSPIPFPMNIIICEKEDYCVVILQETFLKTVEGLALRKKLDYYKKTVLWNTSTTSYK